MLPMMSMLRRIRRGELTLHRAAKDAFNELGGEKLPTIRQLRQEYADLISQKKTAYRDYREAKKQMQEFLKARQNVEMFYGEEMKEEREAAKERSIELRK